MFFIKGVPTAEMSMVGGIVAEAVLSLERQLKMLCIERLRKNLVPIF